MLIDAREVTSGTVLRTDLCVIGAGAAGITMAREFRGSPIDVLLLESRGFEADEKTSALNRGQIVGQPLDPRKPLPLEATRLRYFGGTTNHWAGFCRPLEPIDFETRPYLPESGWPFGFEELEPYYERAQPICGLAPFRYDWQWWDAKHGAGRAFLDDDVVQTLMIQITLQKDFGRIYRGELVNAPNVRVCLWANAVNLRLSPDASRLAGVDVSTLTGKRFRVEAQAYVLATGGIEVPRLLLASNDVRTHGVGNEHDLVGRYFTEHLNLLGGTAVLSKPVNELELYRGSEYPSGDDEEVGRKVWAYGVLNLSRETLRSHELLGMEVSFIMQPLIGAGPAGLPVGQLTFDVAELAGAIRGGPLNTVIMARALCEQAPNRESRVLLTDERDSLGVPRVALDWRHSRIDRESIVRGLAILGSELGRRGLGRLGLLPGWVPLTSLAASDLEALNFPVGVGFHHMGTARMHPDPKRGVVDSQCRVHSVPNLYIAGSAVFSTGGTATPTLTIVALALRLADHLRTRLQR